MTWPILAGPILVPFDFSSASKAALSIARSFAEKEEQINVVYAVAPVTATAPGVVWSGYDEVKLRDNAQVELENAVREAGLEKATVWTEIGHPPSVIVDAAASKNAALVVIPAHGRKGVERWLLGSVTERVVRHAPCPVLVLRAQDLEETG